MSSKNKKASREQEEVAGRLGRLMRRIDQTERQAEKDARAKSEFLARMSHEIRTPMTAIMGMTELAMGTPLTAEQREYLEVIDESSRALLRIINDILDFSKIEAHRLELGRTDFALRETVEGVVKPMAMHAREKGLDLTWHIRKNVPDSLVGDPDRLRQILQNLLSNAIKFTDRGRIVVEVEREEAQPKAAILRFSVADMGIGVPPEMRTLIFDSFSQADTSVTRRYSGTGLGLAIASQLVAMMEGRIWVEEQQPEGSIFRFTARFGLGENRISAPRTPLPAHLRGLPILIVEGNPTSRRTLQEMVRDWGLKPVTAANSPEALALVKNAENRRRPFQLLLVAAETPHVNKLGLVQRIRRLPLHRHASLIVLSETGCRNLPRVRESKPVVCLTKPVTQSELFPAILASLPVDDRPARKRPEYSFRCSAPLSILVAEDNPINQRLILLLLEKIGHRALVARNGEEAITAARRGKIDIVLMDIEMPVLSGLDATRAIREGETAMQTHLPIIAMTAHALKKDRERCLEAGMDGHISKPIQVEALKKVIARFARPPAKPRTRQEAAAAGSP